MDVKVKKIEKEKVKRAEKKAAKKESKKRKLEEEAEQLASNKNLQAISSCLLTSLNSIKELSSPIEISSDEAKTPPRPTFSYVQPKKSTSSKASMHPIWAAQDEDKIFDFSR